MEIERESALYILYGESRLFRAPPREHIQLSSVVKDSPPRVEVLALAAIVFSLRARATFIYFIFSRELVYVHQRSSSLGTGLSIFCRDEGIVYIYIS